MTKKQVEMERYAVIDHAIGDIINIVMWDGVSDWSPGKGCTARKAKDSDRIVSPDDEARTKPEGVIRSAVATEGGGGGGGGMVRSAVATEGGVGGGSGKKT